MKLYTEEQVRQIFENLSTVNGYDYNMELYCSSITPIELPSDEEIYKEARRYENYTKGMDELSAVQSASRYHGFMEGASYVINKIQGGNNEQQ